MDSLFEGSPLDADENIASQLPWGALGRSLTLGFIATASKWALEVMNTIKIHNRESFQQHVLDRKDNQALLTVSNHTSTVDDPALICALMPLGFFFSEHQHLKTRWTLGAKELLYTNETLKNFFVSGKALAVDRGRGVDQPAMREATRLLAHGEWIHLFPEGRVVYDGRIGALRWGVGHMLCNAVQQQAPGAPYPVVLPFYHAGMGQVMPYGARIPRGGHDITVRVGEPIPLDDVLCRCRTETDGATRQELFLEITNRVGAALRELESQGPANKPQPEAIASQWARARRRKEREEARGGRQAGGTGTGSDNVAGTGRAEDEVGGASPPGVGVPQKGGPASPAVPPRGEAGREALSKPEIAPHVESRSGRTIASPADSRRGHSSEDGSPGPKHDGGAGDAGSVKDGPEEAAVGTDAMHSRAAYN